MHGINLMTTERMAVASTFEDQNEGLGAFHCNEIVNTANEGQCIETSRGWFSYFWRELLL